MFIFCEVLQVNCGSGVTLMGSAQLASTQIHMPSHSRSWCRRNHHLGACCSHGGSQDRSVPTQTTKCKALLTSSTYQIHSHFIDQHKSLESQNIYLVHIQKYGKDKEGMNHCEQRIQNNFNELPSLSESNLSICETEIRTNYL